MDNSIVTLMYGVFREFWRLFTSWEFPLLGFTPAQLYFFILVAPLTVRIVKTIISLSLDSLLKSGDGNGKKGGYKK